MKKRILTLSLLSILTVPTMSASIKQPYNLKKSEKTKKNQENQAPGYFRYMLGDYEITSIYDGYATGTANDFVGQEPEKTEEIWRKNFSNTFDVNGKLTVKTASNIFLINTNKELILIDAGSGTSLGETLGFAEKNMILSGYNPKNINKILITHLHPDHINGLTIDGKMIFPNATVYVSKTDYEFWINVIPTLKATLEHYISKKQLILFEVGDQVAEGVKIVPLVGHSVGHVGYEVTSKNEKILFWGDVIHDADVQFSNMDVEVVLADHNKDRIALEIQTAKNITNTVVKEKELVGGAHLPFPGIGHVVKNEIGTGYRWIPVFYNPIK